MKVNRLSLGAVLLVRQNKTADVSFTVQLKSIQLLKNIMDRLNNNEIVVSCSPVMNVIQGFAELYNTDVLDLWCDEIVLSTLLGPLILQSTELYWCICYLLDISDTALICLCF